MKIFKTSILNMNGLEKREILIRIARHLMLQGSFTNKLGLINGKMGIILFFFHYARHTGNTIFDDFAGELIEEMYDGINAGLSDDFDEGLLGIAWSMEHLIQYNFVEGDSNDVLEDLDKRIVERDVRRIKDFSLHSGLLGIAHYVVIRYNSRNSYPLIIDLNFVFELLNSLKYRSSDDKNILFLINCLDCILQGKEIEYNSLNFLKEIIGTVDYDIKTLFEFTRFYGISDSGFAGIGLNLLMDENVL